jgi:hypothetical protein
MKHVKTFENFKINEIYTRGGEYTNKKEVNNFRNELLSWQKSWIDNEDDLETRGEISKISNLFSKLSEEDFSNFFSGVKRYKTIKDLLTAAESFIKTRI